MKKNYEEAYQEIYNKIMDLLNNIAKEKKLDFSWDDNCQSLNVYDFVSAVFDFDYDFALFHNISCLFIDYPWKVKNDDAVNEKNIQNLEKKYQKYLAIYQDYIAQKKKICKQKLENLFNEWKDKFTNLYVQMLAYRNKKPKNETINRLTQEVRVLYPFFDDIFLHLYFVFDYEGLTYWEYEEEDLGYRYPVITIENDPAELFLVLQNAYDNLLTNYKKHANDYPLLEIKDNEDYYDVLNKLLNNFDLLFLKMLEFRGITSKKHGYELKKEVFTYYPFYEERLSMFLSKAGDFKYSVKSILDWYSFYENDYKINYEQRFNEYQKSQAKKEEEIQFDDCLDNDDI